jgi:hypothetical protein
MKKFLQLSTAFTIAVCSVCNAAELVSADLKGPKVPESLLVAYQKITDAIRDENPEVLKTYLLPGSVEVTTAERDPKWSEYGTDMNIPFLKRGFRPTILATASSSPQTFSLRTGTTNFRFVKIEGGIWMIYGYNDEPIE